MITGTIVEVVIVFGSLVLERVVELISGFRVGSYYSVMPHLIASSVQDGEVSSVVKHSSRVTLVEELFSSTGLLRVVDESID